MGSRKLILERIPKKTEQSEAIEAKKTEIPVVNGDDIPISAKPKSSSVNSSSSGSNKNKLKEEKRTLQSKNWQRIGMQFRGLILEMTPQHHQK